MVRAADLAQIGAVQPQGRVMRRFLVWRTLLRRGAPARRDGCALPADVPHAACTMPYLEQHLAEARQWHRTRTLMDKLR